jgi:hypothetical protein
MSFSAAAGNFQFFPSLGGGYQKALRQSAAAAGKFQFVSLCRRLKIFQNFWKNFFISRNFCIKKGENDN